MFFSSQLFALLSRRVGRRTLHFTFSKPTRAITLANTHKLSGGERERVIEQKNKHTHSNTQMHATQNVSVCPDRYHNDPSNGASVLFSRGYAPRALTRYTRYTVGRTVESSAFCTRVLLKPLARFARPSVRFRGLLANTLLDP